MLKVKKLSEQLTIVLRKMFDFVGVEYDEDIVTDSSRLWYSEHSWTKEQEEEFKQWFINYLYTNKAARKTIMSLPRKNKKDIEKTYSWFNLCYGWKELSQ